MSAIVKMRVAGTPAFCRMRFEFRQRMRRVHLSMISSSASSLPVAAGVIGKARVLGQLGLAHGGGKAAEEVVGLAVMWM